MKRARIEDLLTVDDLRTYLTYFPGSGQLVRREKHQGKNIKFGELRTSPNVCLHYKFISAAKACWALYYNEWPKRAVHFRNRNKLDLRIDNLTLSSIRKKRARNREKQIG